MPELIVTDQKSLRCISEKCTLDESKQILEKLSATLAVTPGALGLAAIQIGIPKRVALIQYKNATLELVNPIIVSGYDPIVTSEGCLSLPGKSISVCRNSFITVQDDLNENKFVYAPPVSFAIQHEIDHMDGILILDKEYKSTTYGRNDRCPICNKKIKKCEHADHFLKGAPIHAIS